MVSESHIDAQGFMNYICGGIYALDGAVVELGVNVYAALHEEYELGNEGLMILEMPARRGIMQL